MTRGRYCPRFPQRHAERARRCTLKSEHTAIELIESRVIAPKEAGYPRIVPVRTTTRPLYGDMAFVLAAFCGGLLEAKPQLSEDSVMRADFGPGVGSLLPVDVLPSWASRAGHSPEQKYIVLAIGYSGSRLIEAGLRYKVAVHR